MSELHGKTQEEIQKIIDDLRSENTQLKSKPEAKSEGPPTEPLDERAQKRKDAVHKLRTWGKSSEKRKA